MSIPAPKVMPTNAEWQAAIAPFRTPDVSAARAQLWNTLVPYFVSTIAAYWLNQSVSWWAALPFILLSGLLTVRLFIINHDCCHGSFLAAKKANELIGFWTGLLVFTPYLQWRHGHAIHHRISGDVRQDGTGYVWIQTVKQYESGSFWKRLVYRLYRNPLTIFGIGGAWLFLVDYRWPEKGADDRMRRQVWAIDAFWLTVGVVVSLTLGPAAFFTVQLPIAVVGTSLGVWLFYWQHHYEEAYFGTETTWDFTRAALEGSSFLKLPRWLQFFSGNIGFHHIHHLSPKIPNYKLEACHEAVPFFKSVQPLSLRDCYKAMWLTLVDSETGRWTTFKAAAAAEKARGGVALAASVAPAPLPSTVESGVSPANAAASSS